MILKKKFQFTVNNKPPKKTSKESLWSEDGNQYELVFDLRERALEECNKKGFEGFTGNVKMKISIFAHNTTQRKDSHNYVGDIDALVAGIMDSLQPLPKNPKDEFKIASIFNDRDDLVNNFPKILVDDAQVVEVIAKKIKLKDNSSKPKYSVSMEESK